MPTADSARHSTTRGLMDIAELIDHHCHPVILEPLDRPSFEGLLNEAAAPPPGLTFFDSMLGLAVRRWCGPVLGLPPHAAAEPYVERRGRLGVEASRRLLHAAGISTFLVDNGIVDDRLGTPAELAALADGRTYDVVRLERVAEDLLSSGVTGITVPDRIRATLAATNAVAAKSIAAYRVGLDLPDRPPTDAELIGAVASLRPGPDGRVRLADPVVHGWLAWAAIEAGLPLQVHVGLGDADLDLRRADPLRLTPFLRASEPRGVPVLLLHCYPYQRRAGYLAQVFTHVHCDVGLAVHNSGAFGPGLLQELLEVAPFGKVLFSTDAYGLAELYHLGSLLFRRGLNAVLDGLIAGDELSPADAERVATMILSGNARRVYRLPH